MFLSKVWILKGTRLTSFVSMWISCYSNKASFAAFMVQMKKRKLRVTFFSPIKTVGKVHNNFKFEKKRFNAKPQKQVFGFRIGGHFAAPNVGATIKAIH